MKEVHKMFKYSGPDGLVLESEALKAGEILSHWKLNKGALAATVDGHAVDLDVVVDHDAQVADRKSVV